MDMKLDINSLLTPQPGLLPKRGFDQARYIASMADARINHLG